MELKRKTTHGLTDRVIQFGEGNFLRGFVDWMFDKLNKETGFSAADCKWSCRQNYAAGRTVYSYPAWSSEWRKSM